MSGAELLMSSITNKLCTSNTTITRTEVVSDDNRTYNYDTKLIAALQALRCSYFEHGFATFWLTAARIENLENIAAYLKRDLPDRCFLSVDFFVDGGIARLYVHFSAGASTQTARREASFTVGVVNTLAGLMEVPDNVRVSVRQKVAQHFPKKQPKRTYAPRVLIAKPQQQKRKNKSSKK